jgi:hypothetical protein
MSERTVEVSIGLEPVVVPQLDSRGAFGQFVTLERFKPSGIPGDEDLITGRENPAKT